MERPGRTIKNMGRACAALAMASLAPGVVITACDGAGEGVSGTDAGLALETSGADGAAVGDEQATASPEPAEDLARDVSSTALELDVATMKGRATIVVAASPRPGLSFEIGDLSIESVVAGGAPLRFAVVMPATSDAGPARGPRAGRVSRLDIGVPVGAAPVTVVITYAFQGHAHFDGWMPAQHASMLAPYFCSNLFPCHSSPDDGSTFTMNVTGIPGGETAVYPRSIPNPAPTYMPGIAVGQYAYTELGVTTMGTHVGYYRLPEVDGGVPTTKDIDSALSRMTDLFGWYETTLGPYSFGDHVASVAVKWGFGGPAGMEHHPFWHLATSVFANEEYHAHEAAHGWFGNGVRLRCWEDYVLSEGTVSYITARALEAVRGKEAGDAIWSLYGGRLSQVIQDNDALAWPTTCNQIDLPHSHLSTLIPYMKGAFFYRAVAAQVGVTRLDEVLGTFYRVHVGKSASMADMIATIEAETTFDPAPLVATWLRGLGNPGL